MGLSPNDASGNVTITFADAVVRVLGVELRGLCRLRQRAPEHQSTPFNFTKWDTQKAAGSRLFLQLIRQHAFATRDTACQSLRARPKKPLCVSPGQAPAFVGLPTVLSTCLGCEALT